MATIPKLTTVVEKNTKTFEMLLTVNTGVDRNFDWERGTKNGKNL